MSCDFLHVNNVTELYDLSCFQSLHSFPSDYFLCFPPFYSAVVKKKRQHILRVCAQ